MPDEPDLWYDRFDIFRLLGPIRSVARAYQMAKETNPQLKGVHVNPQWLEISKTWHWAERARAWDVSLRQKLVDQETELAIDLRLSRLQMIGQLQRKAFAALTAANIEDMDEGLARAYFPQLRLLIVSLFGAERAEFGGSIEDEQQASDLPDEIMRNLEKTWGKKVAVDGGATS